MILITLALAPVLIILFYIYFRDKYEKEPLRMLLYALLAGALIVIPVVFVEKLLMASNPFADKVPSAAYVAFVVAGFTEELFKFIALYLVVWKSPAFNEKFDGIVYAVFISLGFAAVENVMYVSDGGLNVALSRALTAVPAHALFGVRMGYYFGISHMYPELRKSMLRMALFIPIVLHGIYDFILMSGLQYLLLLFIPYVIYLFVNGFKRMKVISDASIFRGEQ